MSTLFAGIFFSIVFGKRSIHYKSSEKANYDFYEAGRVSIEDFIHLRWSREWKMKLPEMVYGDNRLTVSFDHFSSKLIVGTALVINTSFLLCMCCKSAAVKTSLIPYRFPLTQYM